MIGKDQHDKASCKKVYLAVQLLFRQSWSSDPSALGEMESFARHVFKGFVLYADVLTTSQ